MALKFNFSLKITLVGFLLIAGMVRASFWQWQRHLEKQDYIKAMNLRLAQPITPIHKHLASTDWEDLTYTRLSITGEYDFVHEITIANRRHQDQAGKYIVTPLKISGTDSWILVQRGFVPLKLSSPEARREFQQEKFAAFVGLIKPALPRTFFLQPADPQPAPGKFFSDWLRVDIPQLQKQLPYKILPIYVEIMNTVEPSAAEKQIIRSDSDRTDMLFLPERLKTLSTTTTTTTPNYPLAVFDNVIPAGRHYGYVWEWALMALGTLLIIIVLQLRRPSPPRH